METRNWCKRLLALLLCLALLWAGTLSVLAADDDEDEDYEEPSMSDAVSDDASDEDEAEDVETGKNAIKDLSDKYDELEKQQKAVKAQIEAASGKKKEKMAVKKQLDNQIALTRQQIQVLTEKIALLEEEIALRELEIEELDGDISANYQQFKQRVRSMYMSGSASNLGLILGAESYSTFLTRAEMFKRLSKHDNELIDSLVNKMGRVREIKDELESDMDELATAKITVEEKRKELNGQLASTNNQIQDLDAMEKEFLANQAELQKQMKEVQEEIAAIYRQIGSSGEYVGGQFAWPLPGYSNITSSYGWRFGGTDFHTGIDISGTGVYGKSIIAANTGTVAFVQTTYTAGRGYGKYLIIDHGGGYSTLYAHCSSIYVNVGDEVAKGDAIAAVGSTGWSTGPHLHFEIRINGEAQNPMSYFTKA